MIYKKIILKPKSGLITPLESDTILSYIFACNFEKLQDIYKKFQDGKDLPFLITNGFLENTLPRPIFFSEKKGKSDPTTLLEDIKNEVDKKKIKKLSRIPFEKNIFELIFTGKDDELRKKLKDFSKNSEFKKSQKIVSEYKNSIPRFNIGDTNPYEIENIEYISGNYEIYVKVFNEADFDSFFDCLKNTFEKIGFGKAKSRGYGHFESVKVSYLEKNELEVFEYLEKLKEKNIYLVLDNYKPTDEEIGSFDLDKSFYQINIKHTKSLNEFNENIFKGQMNFISAGSVINSKKELIGESYISGNSYNFGFIF